jgi:hypothetical protein
VTQRICALRIFGKINRKGEEGEKGKLDAEILSSIYV